MKLYIKDVLDESARSGYANITLVKGYKNKWKILDTTLSLPKRVL